MEVDLCVLGAGPVGAALACRLGAAGLRVAVVDRAPLPPMEHPAFDGRAYAIAATSQQLLEQARVWDMLPHPPCPIHDIRVSDGEAGKPASPLFLHFSRSEVNAEAFGWMVEARHLRMALNRCLSALPSVTVFAPAEARVARDADCATVDVAGGPSITCKLVVGAEGRQSPLRAAAGIPVTRFPYRQSGIVCAIQHEIPHGNTALEHFLPAGPFAQLPLLAETGEGNCSAIVWSDDRDVAERIGALPDAAFAREVGRRLGPHLGRIQMVGRRWVYPLGALHAHRYVDTRMALVGDAAHAIHPIAGQGLNLGFRDVIALAARVIDAPDAGAPALLTAYQRDRRPDNLMMLAATDLLDRLFSTTNPVLRAARRLGIAGVHRMPPVKRAFMRVAMGLGASEAA